MSTTVSSPWSFLPEEPLREISCNVVLRVISLGAGASVAGSVVIGAGSVAGAV